MFQTDKVSHGYLPTYFELAARIGTHGWVLEVGVDVGGSLAMWQDLFPHGVVVGVDHSAGAGWPEGTIQVVAKQEDPGLRALIGQALLNEVDHIQIPPGPEKFDLIVDDASHEGHLTDKTLISLWPMVQPGGWYVIEDWGVGFPHWTPTDDSMLTLAKNLLHSFDPKGTDDDLYLKRVHSITYKDGLIIIQKENDS